MNKDQTVELEWKGRKGFKPAVYIRFVKAAGNADQVRLIPYPIEIKEHSKRRYEPACE